MSELFCRRPTTSTPVPMRRASSARTAARSCPRRSCRRSQELDAAYETASTDPAFAEELDALLRDYVGRPSPLYRADRLAEAVGLGAVYLKREDLNHTGAHKINNTLGQCLLAKRMGKHRVIAETGAGQHGVATATAAALMDLECAVFMGTEDIRRQSLNVYKMRAARRRGHPGRRGHRHACRRRHRGASPLGRARRGHVLRARLGGRARIRIR